jgi:diguanylate cyclase (GGDEF)-like protein/PAS domain S-box-containing protein
MSEPPLLPPSLRSRLAALLPAWCVLAIALCCTLFAWQLSHERSQATAQQRISIRTEQVQNAILTRMLSYEGILSGGVGLFEALGNVDRRQWREYVDSLPLETHFPGILGMGYTQRVKAAGLEAHQRQIRAEGFSEYVVTPVGRRDEYHAIVMLEPFSGRNLRAFGYDMFSEPTRRAAMSRARDTGMPALSGKVTLVQESAYDRQAGALLYVPVYRPGMPKGTVAQRREALQGFVFAPFRMNDLMRGIMGNLFPDLRLEIFEGTIFDAEALLYASDTLDASPAIAENERPRFSQTLPFTFNNTTWTLRVESRPSFEAPGESRRQGGILLGGLIISLLLFGITWSVASIQVRAKSLALRMTQALRGSERRFRAIHDHAAFGIVQTTPEGTIVHTNPAFERMIGYSEAELLGAHWSLFTVADDHAENQRLRRELIRGERDAYHMEKRYICKDGRSVWANLAVTGVRGEDGTLQFMVALIEDISARKQHEEVITHQAFHDALTGLPNRMRFNERLDQALVKARREKTPMALIFLDLDHFKDVNDALGHGAGDALLQEVARRLRTCVRATDTVARIGGDEFTVLLPVIDGPNGAIQVASKILQVLPVTTMADGKPLTVTPSIGISLFPDHGQDAESLIAQADQAMYASKQAGRNRFTLVTPQGVEVAATR